MLELNKIYNLDCREGMKLMDDNSVDLTVTSPPYDDLRTYGDDEFKWDFNVFKEVAQELYRVTKTGGVVVWVVGDAVKNGGETGSSFKQALYFMECGFKLHDTMIYEKNSSTFPAKLTSQRYSQIFEYMFVFTKGKIRKDIKLIADKRNKWAGWTNWGQHSQYDVTGNLVKSSNIKPIAEFSLRTNIWKYSVSFNDKTGHPAVFPEKLVEDHILSWTNKGDTILDPFMGSGTTAKMAMLNERNYIGFEKNEDYYKVSLDRVNKYVGRVNDKVSGVTFTDTEGVTDTLQFSYEKDNELEGKTDLFNKLIEELNVYFNEQSLGILKNLKLTFQSKSNDERVKKVMDETNNTHTLEGVEIKDDYIASLGEDNVKTVDGVGQLSKETLLYQIPSHEDIKKSLVELIDERIEKKLKEISSEQRRPIEYVGVVEPKVYTPPYIDFKLPLTITDGEIKKHRGRPKGSKNKPKIIFET